ncbi:tRNA pseudouridine(13) synthase TruD [Thalassotalea crassostreae]|uniref:tRNA pseudouridine(13) synthase TruD n=1 Tax=Thalassotalea crassostreae TaxID=1763536 RepID=UPI000AAED6EA|nr:tRNA pseudouridine(13) synthase TruD [Thalassotalea crassostreae]
MSEQVDNAKNDMDSDSAKENAIAPLSYLFGQPSSTGDIRTSADDFKVFELLPFEPCGEGEHLIIHIEKTGANTVFVARELAKYFKVKERLVSYAGLKDRNAVTQQYFGVHLPGKAEYDLSDLNIDGVTVLSYQRHNKKLKTGALIGNRFELTIRNVSDASEVEQRWQKVQQHGVPNYFGEQRFGINGNNLTLAKQMFAGKRVNDKKKRGFYLSATRSFIFNQFVSTRIANNTFDTPFNGDVFTLGSSRSIFCETKIDDLILTRLKDQEINISAPLWGAGELKSELQANEFETKFAEQYAEQCRGLIKFGLKQERRSMRLNLSNGSLSHGADDSDDNTLVLSFFLPAGCFATTVLRELLQYQDVSQRVNVEHK